MQKLYIVTLKFAANEKINAIKMIRAFFGIGLAEAKTDTEKLLAGAPRDNREPVGYFGEFRVNIAVTAEEYANFWVMNKPGMFGACRVMDIKPLEVPAFFRPVGV